MQFGLIPSILKILLLYNCFVFCNRQKHQIVEINQYSSG